MKNLYTDTGFYLSTIFTCRSYHAKTALLAMLCIFSMPVIESMEEEKLPEVTDKDNDCWRYSMAISKEDISGLASALATALPDEKKAKDMDTGALNNNNEKTNPQTTIARYNNADERSSTLQSSTESYTSSRNGSLKLIPDPALVARVERVWEHIKKSRPADKTAHESLSEFIIIAPADTTPSYERLAARIMNFKPDEENEAALTSCALYMLNSLCTILKPSHGARAQTSTDIEDHNYFKNAFMWLSDAKSSLIKRNLLRDKQQSGTQAEQRTTTKNGQNTIDNHLQENTSQIESTDVTLPTEAHQQTHLLETAAQELTALTLCCNTYREVSAGPASFNTDGSTMSNDLILLFSSLSDLLRHCLIIQERHSAAEEICLALAELLIHLAEQRPELIDLDHVDVTDLHTNSFLRFLFERKTAFMLQACNSFMAQSETPHAGKSFSLLLPILRNKKMLIALNMVETPFVKEERENLKASTDEAADTTTIQRKDKEDAESDDMVAREFHRDTREETSEKLETEYHMLKQKIIRLISSSEISIHDILKLNHLLNDTEIVFYILQKLESEALADAPSSHDIQVIFQVGPLLGQMKYLCSAISKLRQLNKSETTLKPLMVKRGELANYLLELLNKDHELLERIFSSLPKVEHTHQTEAQRMIGTSLPIFLAVPELQTIPLLCFLGEKFRKETDSHGTDLLMTLFEKALAFIELIDTLPKKDFMDTLSREALTELLVRGQSEKELDLAKLTFQQVKAEQVAQSKRDLDTLALIIKSLIEKEPNLVTMGLLNLPSFKHNKHALLLLARKLMSQPHNGSDEAENAEKLVYRFVELGKSISLAVQSRYAVEQKLIGKKAKSEKKRAQAQLILETLPTEITQLEKTYRETLGSVQSIAEGNGTIVMALNEHTEFLTPEALKAALDKLEASCKKAGSLPRAHFIEKLRSWQGNAPELLNCGPLCDRENPAECKVFALLINDYLNQRKKEIDEKKEQLKKAQQAYELHAMRIEHYTATVAETAAAHEQAAIDLQEIAGALHALHTAFPQAVSPDILREYPIPNDSWWRWWNYSPLSYCVVM